MAAKSFKCIHSPLLPYLYPPIAELVDFHMSMTQSDVHPTDDQEVTGSIPAGSSNILSYDFILSVVILSLSLFQGGQLAKECAQILVNHLED